MKKWNRLLLSAVMINTVAVPSMVHATTVTTTTTADTTEINKIVSDYDQIFNTTAKAATADQFRTAFNTYVTANINNPTVKASWFTVNGTDLESTINAKIVQHFAGTNITPPTASDYIQGLLPFFVPDGATFATDVQNIRTQYSSDFNTLFGSNVTVDGTLIPFAADLEQELKNPTVWGNALANNTINSSLMNTVLHTAVENLLSNTTSPYHNLDGDLSNGLGISLSQLLDIRQNMIAGFENSSSTNANLYSAVKSDLISFALTQITSSGGGGGGTGGGGSSTGGDTGSIDNGGLPTSGLTDVTPPTTVTVEKQADGTSVNVVKLDETTLLSTLTKTTDAKAIVVPVKTDGGAGQVDVSGNLLTQAASNNPNSSLRIVANGSSYDLPVSLVNQNTISQALGGSTTDLSKVTVSVVITQKPQTLADNVAEKTGGKVLSNVVDFSIQVSNGTQTAELNNFSNTYVSRALDLTGQADPSNTVGVVLNADGTFAPVPTVFTTDGSTNVAILKRDGNSAYTVLSNNVMFSDINNSWAKADIQLLANKLIVSGYNDGTFKPSANITRGEFVTLLARSLGLSKSTNVSKFSDVSSSAFYAGYLQAAVEAGLVGGFEDGTFRGNQNITRQDAMVLLSKAIDFLKLRGNLTDAQAVQALQNFKDGSHVSGYAQTAVGVSSALHLVNGDENGDLNPTSKATRAETVIMIEKLLTTANFLSK